MADLNIRLTPPEFLSLRKLSKNPLERTVPLEHRDKLTALRLIESMPGSVTLTAEGRMRLMQEW